MHVVDDVDDDDVCYKIRSPLCQPPKAREYCLLPVIIFVHFTSFIFTAKWRHIWFYIITATHWAAALSNSRRMTAALSVSAPKWNVFRAVRPTIVWWCRARARLWSICAPHSWDEHGLLKLKLMSIVNGEFSSMAPPYSRQHTASCNVDPQSAQHSTTHIAIAFILYIMEFCGAAFLFIFSTAVCARTVLWPSNPAKCDHAPTDIIISIVCGTVLCSSNQPPNELLFTNVN